MTKQKLDFSDNVTRDWLKDLLRSEVVSITFEKSDGTERKLKCTLMESKIPTKNTPKGTQKVQNPNTQPVFDVENSGWRSFRWDSVKKIEFTLGE